MADQIIPKARPVLTMSLVRDLRMWHIIAFCLLWDVLGYALLRLYWGHTYTLVVFFLIYVVGSVALPRMISQMSRQEKHADLLVDKNK